MVPVFVQMADYKKEEVKITPSVDEYETKFSQMIDTIVTSVESLPRVEKFLFQGKQFQPIQDGWQHDGISREPHPMANQK